MTRVLLADDHHVVRYAIRSILDGREDIQVIGEASNGEEVIKQALDYSPDLIVMDIGLPLVNGLTAAEMIKKFRPNTTIVAFTMYDSSGMENVAKELGIDAFVTKSEGSSALLKTIESIPHNRENFHD